MIYLSLDRELSRADPDKFVETLNLTRSHLCSLSDQYPDFAYWFNSKVTPGLETGERKILIAKTSSEISAIAIVKHTGDEQKLCCLRVLPGFEGSGIGVKLFVKAFEALQTTSPLLSVSEEKFPVFQKIFDYFGFELGSVYNGYYRPRRLEYSFNGILDIPHESIICTPQPDTQIGRSSNLLLSSFAA